MADLASLANQPHNQQFALVPVHPKLHFPILNLSHARELLQLCELKGKKATFIVDISPTNNHGGRITWRILCNATTRYVVSPNKGFLTAQEQIRIEVTLVAANKYNYRQALLVQAKVASPSENNRKVVWEKMDNLDVQSIKIATSMDGVKIPSPLSASSSASGLSLTGSISNSSIDSTGTTTGSTGSLASDSSLISQTEKDHGEFKAKVEQLEANIRKNIEQKDSVTSRLVLAVNEVKKLEVDLDRAGNEVVQMQAREYVLAKKNQDLKQSMSSMKAELQVIRGNRRISG